MFIEEHKLFPTLILQIKKFLSKDDCIKILDIIKNRKDLLNKHASIKGEKAFSSHDPYSNFVFEVKNLNLTERILRCSEEYSARTGFHTTSQICNSWVNIEGKNSYLKKHSHPNCVLSGVIFVNCDDQSRPLYFYNPNPYVTYTKAKFTTDCTYEWYRFSPQRGDMLIFPSWLHHGSNEERNLSEGRTVISFNVV
jgi:uncharacterized protein (TIGR02466 family)